MYISKWYICNFPTLKGAQQPDLNEDILLQVLHSMKRIHSFKQVCTVRFSQYISISNLQIVYYMITT